MTAPTWEDLDEFLSVDDFATVARFVTEAGDQQVIGIFDEPYFNVELGEYDMATGEPRFTCNEADVLGVRRNDECIISGVSYCVDHDPHPDGTGIAVVKLSRAPMD